MTRRILLSLVAAITLAIVPSDSYAWGWYPGKFLFGGFRTTYYYNQSYGTQTRCSSGSCGVTSCSNGTCSVPSCTSGKCELPPAPPTPTCDAEPIVEKEYAIEQIEFQLTEQEQALVNATNAWRQRCGLNALKININLCNACRSHSNFMYNTGQFSHYTVGDGSPWSRAAAYGTTCSAENIAGVGNGVQAFSMFQQSSGHNQNMLRSSHTEIGVGIVGNKTTQMFR